VAAMIGQHLVDPLHAMQFRAVSTVQVSAVRPVRRLPPSDRDCPLDTARARSLWHAGGTTGENDGAFTWRQRLLLGQRVRPVLGDHRSVAKSPEDSRQIGH
jgi:hypothetical protein